MQIFVNINATWKQNRVAWVHVSVLCELGYNERTRLMLGDLSLSHSTAATSITTKAEIIHPFRVRN